MIMFLSCNIRCIHGISRGTEYFVVNVVRVAWLEKLFLSFLVPFLFSSFQITCSLT